MKKLILILLLFISYISYGQVVLTIDGIDTTVVTATGYDVPRASATTLTIKRSKFTSALSGDYLLKSGTDGPTADDNNLDGAKIMGNKFVYSGGSLSSNLHGIMAGFNIDYTIRHNYFWKLPYGPVIKAETMTWTYAAESYNIFYNNRQTFVGGVNNVKIYNNTFYNSESSVVAAIRITEVGSGNFAKATKIYNNVFYSTKDNYAVLIENSASLVGFECDYNVYYWSGEADKKPRFELDGVQRSWAQWQALGYDTHSVVVNPNFVDTVNFVPAERLDYGTSLGVGHDYGLSRDVEWVVGQYPDTVQQNGTWQAGAVIYENSTDYHGDYFVSPTGSDAGTGAIGDPWLTWKKAFDTAEAGDTVYIRGGVYPITSIVYYGPNSGTYSNPICFFNYPGEVPILDGTGKLTGTSAMWWSNRHYLHFRGLTIRNIPQISSAYAPQGWGFGDCNGVTLENCTAHNIGMRGFYFYNPDTTYVYNCDAYNCVDSLSSQPGNGGDGFLVTGTHLAADTSAHVIFRGCRSWHNSDDGWDAHTEGYVELDSCWAISNGTYSYVYGNGMKLGLSMSVAMTKLSRKVTNSIAIYNRGSGFTTNDDFAKASNIYNNIAAFNGIGSDGYGFTVHNCINGDVEEAKRIYRNNIGYGNLQAAFHFSGGTAAYTHSNNSWDIPLTFSDADFASVDSTGITGARTAQGYLPTTTFLKLSDVSQAIDAGVDVGLAYSGTAPDIGYYEWNNYPAEPAIPTISTIYPYGVSSRTATSGGYLIADGGGTISAKGICWATDANPDLTDNVVSGGSGVDDFIVAITGLTANTTYHIRSFATNENGTGYGGDLELTTVRISGVSYNKKVVRHLGKTMIIR